MSSLIRKGSRSPMSRNSLTSTRRTRAVWDRTATDTRLLLMPQPYPVSLGNTMNPLRMTLIASAPSRPPSPQRHLAADACGLLPQMISLGYPGHRASGFAADARVPSPRMITHGSHPKRACPTTVDARVLPRMISRSASLGVEADACGFAADDFPLRPHRRRSGCLRHCAADDLPRPVPGRRGSAGKPHPHPFPVPLPPFPSPP